MLIAGKTSLEGSQEDCRRKATLQQGGGSSLINHTAGVSPGGSCLPETSCNFSTKVVNHTGKRVKCKVVFFFFFFDTCSVHSQQLRYLAFQDTVNESKNDLTRRDAWHFKKLFLYISCIFVKPFGFLAPAKRSFFAPWQKNQVTPTVTEAKSPIEMQGLTGQLYRTRRLFPPEESLWPGGWGTRSWEAGGQGRPRSALCPPPTGPCLWPPVEALQDAPERADEFCSPETKISLLLSISTCSAVCEHCLRLLLQRPCLLYCLPLNRAVPSTRQ